MAPLPGPRNLLVKKDESKHHQHAPRQYQAIQTSIPPTSHGIWTKPHPPKPRMSRSTNGSQAPTRTRSTKTKGEFIFSDRPRVDIVGPDMAQCNIKPEKAYQTVSKYGLKFPEGGLTHKDIAKSILEFMVTAPSLTQLHQEILRALSMTLDHTGKSYLPTDEPREPQNPQHNYATRLESAIQRQEAQTDQLETLATELKNSTALRANLDPWSSTWNATVVFFFGGNNEILSMSYRISELYLNEGLHALPSNEFERVVCIPWSRLSITHFPCVFFLEGGRFRQRFCMNVSKWILFVYFREGVVNMSPFECLCCKLHMVECEVS